MSTHSNIAILRNTGTYDYIYSHSDGGYIGTILKECYNTEKLASELISLGDISLLAKRLHPTTTYHSFERREEGICVFYKRDRDESGCETQSAAMLHEFIGDFDYAYVFRNGSWECYYLGKLLKEE